MSETNNKKETETKTENEKPLVVDLLNRIHEFYFYQGGFPPAESMYYCMYHCRSPIGAALGWHIDGLTEARLENLSDSVEYVLNKKHPAYPILSSLLPRDLDDEAGAEFICLLQAVHNTVVSMTGCKFQMNRGSEYGRAFFRELFKQSRHILSVKRWPIRTVRVCDLYNYLDEIGPYQKQEMPTEDSF